MRCLLAVQDQAAARHAEFRVAVPLSSPVRRIMHMTGLDQQLRLFPTAAHAAAGNTRPPQNRQGREPVAMR
jgi:anti-anti-sigma regulatory factor